MDATRFAETSSSLGIAVKIRVLEVCIYLSVICSNPGSRFYVGPIYSSFIAGPSLQGYQALLKRGAKRLGVQNCADDSGKQGIPNHPQSSLPVCRV